MLHVRNSSDLIPVFAVPPEGILYTPSFVYYNIKFILGGTPIARVLREIQERKLLIRIVTDDQGRPDILSLKNVLTYERNPLYRIPVTIIACTGIRKEEKKERKLF